jgi:hypothetical protein
MVYVRDNCYKLGNLRVLESLRVSVPVQWHRYGNVLHIELSGKHFQTVSAQTAGELLLQSLTRLLSKRNFATPAALKCRTTAEFLPTGLTG